ncbi:unnamed protein product, partial [Candidula unifasciata]
ALLADLQNTTANISCYQKVQQYPSQPNQEQYYPGQQFHHLHNDPCPVQDFQQPAQSSIHVGHNQNYNNQRLGSSTTDLDPTFQQPAQSLIHVGHNQNYNNQRLGSSTTDLDPTFQQHSFHSSVKYPAENSWAQENLRYSTEENSTESFHRPEITSFGEGYHSSGGNSGSSTPPPLPPPPLDIIDFDRDFEQPIYEQQTFHIREATPSSSLSDTSDRGAVQQVRSGRDRGERMSALSSNLSELDQLLQDLNSAQFMAEVDRKSGQASEVTVVNGALGKNPPPVAPKPASKPAQRTSVDNLLDQLEGVGSPLARLPVDPHYQELNSVTTGYSQNHSGADGPIYRATSSSSASSTSSHHQPQTASSATKELDELMMSLSEFRNKGDGTVGPNEPAYAKPLKSRSISSSSPTSPGELGPTFHQGEQQSHLQHQQTVQQQAQRENGLETMLGDLQSDLNRQGVSTKQKGVCAACQKPIVGQVIAALGRTWHVEHFVCAHCEEPLGTRSFYERDSLAYCEKDYHHLFAPRCAYCSGPIVDKCITALEKMWHPEHFFCAQCGRPFGEEDFHEKNGKAYCREDYFQMFAPKCGGCAQPIMENYISALNRQWHPECFVCWECQNPFGAGSFFDYEGLPYCETHYHAKKGSLCASCERPITGRCITAMFRKFHPEHFVCAFCLKQLNKGTFKEQNDKPYCHPCFVKLFG